MNALDLAPSIFLIFFQPSLVHSTLSQYHHTLLLNLLKLDFVTDLSYVLTCDSFFYLPSYEIYHDQLVSKDLLYMSFEAQFSIF